MRGQFFADQSDYGESQDKLCSAFSEQMTCHQKRQRHSQWRTENDNDRAFHDAENKTGADREQYP
jgi:hypothetical protein